MRKRKIMLLLLLSFFCLCGIAIAETIPYINLSNWTIGRGIAKMDNGLLVVGNSNGDTIHSNDIFNQPISVTWKGYFPDTSYSYHGVGFGQSLNIQGFPEVNDYGFWTRWENQDHIFMAYPNAPSDLDIVPDAVKNGDGYFYGEYTLQWQGNIVTYFFNGKEVGKQPFTSSDPVFLFMNCYDKAFKIEGITVVTPLSVNAGADQTVDEGSAVTLAGSVIADNPSRTFEWKQIAGDYNVDLSNANTLKPTFIAPQLQGGFGSTTLTFQVTARAGDESASDTVNITVTNINHTPVANAGVDQAAKEGSLITLNGTDSYDPDGERIKYHWTAELNGTPIPLTGADTAKPTFTAPILSGEVGDCAEISASLVVSDGVLESAPAVVKVKVEQVNHAPIADAGEPQTTTPDKLVILNGTKSTDPDGDTLSFQWTQVGEPTVTLLKANTATPTFVAPKVSGSVTLTFRLKISDSELSSSRDVSVTVKNGTPLCNLARPSINMLWPPNHGLVSESIVGVTDPDENRVVITVTGVTQNEPVNGLGDGDTSPDAVVQDGQFLLRAERSGKGAGRIYRVNFTADDGEGGTCNGTVKVVVPDNKKPDSVVIDNGLSFNSTLP